MSDSRPTFQELRQKHHVSLQNLIEDTQMDPRAVLLIDKWGIGTPEHIDRLLATLTRLAGKEYSRRTLSVGNVTFKLHPNYDLIPQEEISLLLAADENIHQRNL